MRTIWHEVGHNTNGFREALYSRFAKIKTSEQQQEFNYYLKGVTLIIQQ